VLLHSQILGEGTPFIILHGFLGMSDNWKSLGKKFAAEGYQVHLVDQRNHGHSFRSDDFSYDFMVEDLHQYCVHHQLENFVLLGHSMGGKAAMNFAAKYSDVVAKLIIADIGPKYYPQHHQDILKALSLLNFNEITSRKQADEAIQPYISNLGTRLFLLKNLYWVERGQLGMRINLKVLIDNVEEVGKALDPEAYFGGDVEFIRGGNSDYIEDNDALMIKKQFPKAEISTVPDAGHWLHAENPTVFYKMVMGFLVR
jgi:pimeloyl-ACP methyl ester carboxylesterase